LLYGRNRMNPAASDRADGVKSWRISKRVVRLTYTAAARSSRNGANELFLTTLPSAIVPANDSIRSLDRLDDSARS